MHKLSPVQILFLGYTFLISLGVFFLSLPIARVSQSFDLLKVIFTAVSAVCVTGLTVVNIGTYFTTFGQNIVMLLIQFGGMGYMVLASMLVFFFGKKISLRSRLAIQDNYTNEMTSAAQVILKIIKYTFVFELIGLLLMSVRFIPQFGFFKGLYFSLFHSVSAFCNAGFSLFSNSLVNYAGDVYLNTVFAVLIVIGGLGFVVISDIRNIFSKDVKFTEVSLHTKMVLVVTGLLLIFGFIHFFFIEGLDFIKAFFLTVTARTAGFNTVDISLLKGSSFLVLMFLMFVGASPGGTGGGVKTTTLFTLLLVVWTNLKGREDISFMGRTITKWAVRKSMTVVFMYASAFFIGLILISDLEHIPQLSLMFETFSAIGTVGLSTGITASLSFISKIILIVLMIIGRLGPIAFGSALFNIKDTKVAFKYPEEKILIG